MWDGVDHYRAMVNYVHTEDHKFFGIGEISNSLKKLSLDSYMKKYLKEEEFDLYALIAVFDQEITKARKLIHNMKRKANEYAYIEDLTMTLICPPPADDNEYYYDFAELFQIAIDHQEYLKILIQIVEEFKQTVEDGSDLLTLCNAISEMLDRKYRCSQIYLLNLRMVLNVRKTWLTLKSEYTFTNNDIVLYLEEVGRGINNTNNLNIYDKNVIYAYDFSIHVMITSIATNLRRPLDEDEAVTFKMALDIKLAYDRHRKCEASKKVHLKSFEEVKNEVYGKNSEIDKQRQAQQKARDERPRYVDPASKPVENKANPRKVAEKAIDEQIKQVRERFETERQKVTELEQNVREKRARLEDLVQRLAQARSDGNGELVTSLTSESELANIEYRLVDFELEKAKLNRDISAKNYDKLNLTKNITAIENNIKDNAKLISEYEEQLKILLERDPNDGKITQLNQEIEQIRINIVEYQNQINNINVDIEEINRELRQMNDDLKHTLTEIAKLNKKLRPRETEEQKLERLAREEYERGERDREKRVRREERRERESNSRNKSRSERGTTVSLPNGGKLKLSPLEEQEDSQ